MVSLTIRRSIYSNFLQIFLVILPRVLKKLSLRPLSDLTCTYKYFTDSFGGVVMSWGVKVGEADRQAGAYIRGEIELLGKKCTFIFQNDVELILNACHSIIHTFKDSLSSSGVSHTFFTGHQAVTFTSYQGCQQ